MKRNQYYRPANRNHMRKQNHAFAIFAILAAVLMLIGVSAKACDEIYLKAGAGYKLAEADRFEVEGIEYRVDTYASDSARFGAGCIKGNFDIGIDHYSQFSTGWPFNDKKEPNRTEIYIEYRWSWSL